jgi:hypothetical protein
MVKKQKTKENKELFKLLNNGNRRISNAMVGELENPSTNVFFKT